jgi:hypothetical protein
MSKSGAEWRCPGPKFGCCFSVCWFDKNRWPNGGIPDPNLSAENITKSYFWAEICSNFMRDTFTINIDFVSE